MSGGTESNGKIPALFDWSLRAGKWVEKEFLKPVRSLRRRFLRPPLESLPDAPDWFNIYRYLHKHQDVERHPGGWVYKGGFYPDYLTLGGASHAISRIALQFCKGEGADVGAGAWPLNGAIPVDSLRGPGAGRRMEEFEDSSLDYVFSSHCLEHIEDWEESLKEWVNKVRIGGVIFLYLPHPDCAIWHPGSPFVGEGHKWVPTPWVVKRALRELGCKIMQCDDGPDAMWSFYVCGYKRLLTDPQSKSAGLHHSAL